MKSATLRQLAVWSGCALGAAFLGARASDAGSITYEVNQRIGAGSVTGTIITDGATGVLGPGDITAWDLILNGVGASLSLSNMNSGLSDSGSDLTATTSELDFDFSATNAGYLLFQVSSGSGAQYYCDQSFPGFPSAGPCLQGAGVVPIFFSDPSSQFASETGNQVIATAAAVPEPGTLALFGSVLFAVALVRPARRLAVNK